VTTAEGNLFDPSSLARAVEDISAIIHLAAVFRTPDTDLIWKSNLEGTRNLIAAAKARAPDARFIMASTSNVYNIDSPHPGREGDAADPKLAYPASKFAAENELRDSGLNWSIQRFGFVYGDGDGHLESLPKLAAQGASPVSSRPENGHDPPSRHRHRHEPRADWRHGRAHRQYHRRGTDLELVGETMEPSSESLANPWHLHVDGSLARRLGFQPTVRTVIRRCRRS
jgi:UDP-glucose 4-epimerase